VSPSVRLTSGAPLSADLKSPSQTITFDRLENMYTNYSTSPSSHFSPHPEVETISVLDQGTIRRMSTQEQVIDTSPPAEEEPVYVPLTDFPGWFVSVSYLYKGGKTRLRSCVFCRRRKITCNGASPTGCAPCTNKKQDCNYALTETELDKFHNLKQSYGLETACQKLGLKRAEEIGVAVDPAHEMLQHIQAQQAQQVQQVQQVQVLQPQMELSPAQMSASSPEVIHGPPGLFPPVTHHPGVPSLLLSATLISYFMQPGLAPPYLNLNHDLFESLASTEPVLVHAAAYTCLAVYIPPNTPELRENFPLLASLSPTQIFSYVEALHGRIKLYLDMQPPSWTWQCIMGLFAVGYAHRGMTEDLEWMSAHLANSWNALCDDAALNPQNGPCTLTVSEWIRWESLRRSFWMACITIDNMAFAKGCISISLPWHHKRRLPILSSENAFANAHINQKMMDSSISGWGLSEEEWRARFTIDWLALPPGEERTRALEFHIGRMYETSPWNFFTIAVEVALRACRGSLELGWPGSIVSDLEDAGNLGAGYVDLLTWTSPAHWNFLLDDIFAHLPPAVRDADAEGRGDLLYQLAQQLWGDKFAMRLIVSLNWLHEARMGCIIRSMAPGQDVNDYVADMFITKTDPDEMLMGLLNEAMLISRNFGSLLNINPHLKGVALGPFPQMLRIGVLHLALARRMQKIGLEDQSLVDAAEEDAQVTLQVLEILSQRAPWLDQQKNFFKRLLEAGTEPSMQDIGHMYARGFGFLRR
jgi:hypothetical protein